MMEEEKTEKEAAVLKRRQQQDPTKTFIGAQPALRQCKIYTSGFAGTIFSLSFTETFFPENSSFMKLSSSFTKTFIEAEAALRQCKIYTSGFAGTIFPSPSQKLSSLKTPLS